ncbi:MAG: MBL fold metallo-hydrolase [Clostridia bacterium]|nr:MBL fold metallo-hydrolase [Clostridia bacterium]
MIDNIEVFKQNHIKIDCGGLCVHIDPFKADSAPKNADIILITHDHYDHFSPNDIERVAGRDAVLVVPEAMRAKASAAGKYVGRIGTVKPGCAYAIGGLEFETVPAYNIGKPFHPKSAGWVGYIIKAGGKRVYIAGDTDATDEAGRVICDIALVPVGGTYTMNAKQAAELVNAIKPEIAVPVHYGGIVGAEKDGADFQAAVDKSIKVVLKIKF